MARSTRTPGEKALFWVGSSKTDLMKFPAAVRDEIGLALSVAQFGGKHFKAKPWKGEAPGVIEIVEDFRGDAYRAIYTVQFRDAIYVLHAFQKKSPHGIKTPLRDVELIRSRLRLAAEDYETRYGKKK